MALLSVLHAAGLGVADWWGAGTEGSLLPTTLNFVFPTSALPADGGVASTRLEV